MAYLGIYTNDLNNFDLSEHLKADTIEELEKKKTSKQYLKIFELNEDILEEAELVCTKVLKWGVTDAEKREKSRAKKERYFRHRLWRHKLWFRFWLWRTRARFKRL